jgi:hypothetical protein
MGTLLDLTISALQDEPEVDTERDLAHPEYVPVVEAGVHEQVAVVICGNVYEGAGLSVTWALVLARLLTMEGPARRRLAQTFGDWDKCVSASILSLFDYSNLHSSQVQRNVRRSCVS